MRPRRILIVDDEEDHRELHAIIFSGRGMLVIQAENGLDALQKALESRPDVILMDLRMPLMGGVEAMKRLKADERTAAIPIVVLSGNAHQERDEVMRAGCSICLVKPCLPVDLEGAVLSIVEPAGAESQRVSSV